MSIQEEMSIKRRNARREGHMILSMCIGMIIGILGMAVCSAYGMLLLGSMSIIVGLLGGLVFSRHFS